MRHHPFIALALAGLVTAACATSSSRTGTAGATTAASRRSSTVITAEELEKADATNAYDAVRRLRPSFLTPHGVTSMGAGANDGVVVYVDNTRFGDASSLNQIPISEVKEIQYLSASEATQRFGTGHTQGAIIVIRK